MGDSEKRRIKRVALAAALFFASGILYWCVVRILGGGIPCVFHEVTGLRCPGCGITHFAVSAAKLDFGEALRANMFAPVIIVFCAWTAFYTSYKYIRTGCYRLTAGSTAAEVIFLAAFVLWGVARNIRGI